MMNPNVRWPIGAKPRAHLMQQHDEHLLCDELEHGKARPEL